MIRARQLLEGIPASPGKAYSKVLKLYNKDQIILYDTIPPNKVNHEIKKFAKCLASIKSKLQETIHQHSEDIEEEISHLLHSQISLLDDPMLVEGVKNRIATKFENSSLATSYIINDISKRLEALENPIFRERTDDIKAIGKLIEEELSGQNQKTNLATIRKDVILIAKELSPFQAIQLNKSKIKGFITEKGGITGHLAILARSYKIPAIVGVEEVLNNISKEDFIFMDGESGIFIRNPYEDEIPRLHVKQQELPKQHPPIQETCTKDGTRIQLKLNIEDGESYAEDFLTRVDGVGLYRSESLILKYKESVSEEIQYKRYLEISENFRQKPVIIRSFDLGADKTTFEFQEDNPFLGCRGIRYLLYKPKLFTRQIRAMLRANVNGNLALMLPMVTSLQEIQASKEHIIDCCAELQEAGIPHKKFKLGAMFETPAFSFFLDSLAPHIDFLSMGTNDLLQYTIAVDRNHPKLWKLNEPYHLAFLRILQKAVKDAQKYSIPIAVCGEIASIPEFALLLVGMGYRELSISPLIFERIQYILASTDSKQLDQLLQEVLVLSQQEKYLEIKKTVQKYTNPK
ncbi:MAG: phosphoenolpyruvate--protein phosphotransferase [Spirochaetota bacterium]